MVELNLTAMTTEEIILKDYLENNASEYLAEKINNGVHIEKDGKTLINKKTLEHFMTDYASSEAKKQAKQGARSVGIYKDAVFNWLVHYFEEDSIEGKLYNLDGTEYKTTTLTKSVKPVAKPAAPAKPKPMDFFDMMAAQQQDAKLAEFESDESQTNGTDETESDGDDELSEEEQDEILDELAAETDTNTPPEAVREPVTSVSAEPEVQQQLRKHIADNYSHPTNNIIVCGMPTAQNANGQLKRISEKHCADEDGVVYEIPSFIQNLFGEALKIEVGQ